MQINVEVGIDVGGSGTKISVRQLGFSQLTPPIWFSNKSLFCQKSKAGLRVSKAIMDVTKYYFSCSVAITTIGISLTGFVDHHKNILKLSHRLDQAEETGCSYEDFDLAQAIKQGMKVFSDIQTKVILLHDSISACVDPSFIQKLILTLTIGTNSVIGLSQKQEKITIIYDKFLSKWPHQIMLSTGKNITMSLRDAELKEKDDFTNCQIITQAIIQILRKYKQVFHQKPSCMVILGGNASPLRLQNKWPQETNQIKLIVKSDHEESVKTQMRGALHYARSILKFKMI